MPTPPVWIVLEVQLEPLLLNPPIWRRLVVNGDCTLRKLHHFLQAAMGWTSAHLHEFTIAERRYLPPDPDFPAAGDLDDRRFKLQRLVREGDRFRYLYDFGDAWQHVIAVERILPAEQSGTFCQVLDGARACPPEDIGGVHGFHALLHTLQHGPANADERELLEQVGAFEPALFDRQAATAATLRICNNLWG